MHFVYLGIHIYGARVLTNDPDLERNVGGLLFGLRPVAKQIADAIRSLEKLCIRVDTVLMVAKDGKYYIRALPPPEIIDPRLLEAPGTVCMSFEEVCDARASATY